MSIWTDLAWNYYRLKELNALLKDWQWHPEYVERAAVVAEVKRIEAQIARLEAEGARLNQEAET